MPLFVEPYDCPLCGHRITDRDDAVGFTHFIGNHADPCFYISDAVVHRSCFKAWRLRDEFIAKYDEFHKGRNFLCRDGTEVCRVWLFLLPLRLGKIVAYYVLPAAVAAAVLLHWTRLTWWTCLAISVAAACLIGSMTLFLREIVPTLRYSGRPDREA